MTRQLFEDNMNRAQLDFTAMFDALTPEYRSSVVMRALRARDHVSPDAGRAFDSAIRGSIRITGYSNPALAISSTLLEPVNGTVAKSEKLAAAILRVWAESMDELEKLVSNHLSSQGLPTDYPDLDNSRFRGFWDETAWEKEMDWIIDLSESWSEEDVALMLCYVSGRTISFDDDGEDGEDGDYADDSGVSTDSFVDSIRVDESPRAAEPERGPAAPQHSGVIQEPAAQEAPTQEPEEVEAPGPDPEPTPEPRPEPAVPAPSGAAAELRGPAILNQCIDYLRSLSPEDGNWNQAVPAFVEAVSDIRALKSAQRERRASLVTAHSEITEEFSADLEFLEQDMSFWSAQGLTELAELDRTLELAAGLRNLLNEYREVRRPGATLSEERGRRERRSALEPRIIDTMGLVRQAMSGARGELVYEPVDDDRGPGLADG